MAWRFLHFKKKDSVRAPTKIAKARNADDQPHGQRPSVGIEIQGSKSKGVSNMQIFCFDMMLTLLSLEQGRSQLPHPRCESYCSTGLSGRSARPWRSERSCATEHGLT